MLIAALQMPTLSMSESRIDYYMQLASRNKIRVVLLAEYNLNSFFTELIKMPKSMVKEQIEHNKKLFCKMAARYNLNIIAPIVIYKNKNTIIKGCAKFSPNSYKFYPQRFLISYKHWNEKVFFNNNNVKFKNYFFTIDGYKFAIVLGFETHFDICFRDIFLKNIDCILVPTACTFDSNIRWQELLKIRAFTNNAYLLRSNRIGKAKFNNTVSDFYGDSFFVSPLGKIIDMLDDKEGLLCVNIDKNILNDSRKNWKFREIYNERFKDTKF